MVQRIEVDVLTTHRAILWTVTAFAFAFGFRWIGATILEDGTPNFADTLSFAGVMAAIMAGMCLRMILKKQRVRPTRRMKRAATQQHSK